MEFYKVLADGRRAVTDGAGLISNVEVLTVATTLVSEDAGKVFSLQGATDGAAIALPVVESGFNARFYVGAAFATTNWTIVATTNVIQGSANVNSVSVLAANENTISFVATAETVGDYIDIESDGTNYFVSGVGAAAGGVTFTAP